MSMEQWKQTGSKKAIFFDLNGTLIDSGKTFEGAFISALEDVSGRWTADSEQLCRHALQLYRKEQERRKARPAGGGGGHHEAIRLACLEKAVEGLPLGKNPAFIRRLDKTIREKQELHPRLYPGTSEAMSEMAQGRQLALISNGCRERLLRRISRSGLGSFFPAGHVFTAAPGRRGKPHPDVFRQAMRALGVRPEEALMVGDSRTKDVAGAFAVGMDACWFRPGSGGAVVAAKKSRGWLLEVESLEQLAALFR